MAGARLWISLFQSTSLLQGATTGSLGGKGLSEAGLPAGFCMLHTFFPEGQGCGCMKLELVGEV
jgi:hypothetical protein